MKNFDWKKAIPHVVAVGLFLIISSICLYPAFQGKGLKQDDIDNHKGVAKEVYDHRNSFGEEPLWTGSMFGGMPATQVSVSHSSNLMVHMEKVITFGLPNPVRTLFLYIIGFYILCVCIGIKPWVSILGAIMFGFSTFFFVSLAVGHNSKVAAMAYMPMVIGTFIYTLRNKAVPGAILFAFFMALELRSNHVQITYYAFLIMLCIGVLELIKYIKEGRVPSLLKRVGLLLVGGGIAVACNYGVISMTYDYLPDSQRGPSELTMQAPGVESKAEGMGLDYMTNWSYGTGESVNLIVPNAKGKASGLYLLDEEMMEGDKSSAELKAFIGEAYQNMKWNIHEYWGNQPGTSGPVYIGAIVFFLFFLGMVFLKDNIKWPLVIISVIALMLSWGHNLMWFTELFANVVPGYSKFRSVTMILVIVELALPVIGIMWVNQLVKNADFLSAKTKIIKWELPNDKLFYILSGLFVFFLFILAVAPDVFLNFTNNMENYRFAFYAKDPVNAIKFANMQEQLVEYRMGIMKADAWRSFGLVVAAIVALFIFFKKYINQNILIAALSVLCLIDLLGVSTRYLHNGEHTAREQQMLQATGLKHWDDKEVRIYPHVPKAADVTIFEEESALNPNLGTLVNQKIQEVTNEYGDNDHYNRIAWAQTFSVLNLNSNYRVLEFGNPLNTARTSFFHKSVGGYSAVKVKRIQELIEFKFQSEYAAIGQAMNSAFQSQDFSILDEAYKKATFLNLLNTKYFIIDPNSEGIVDSQNPARLQAQPGIMINHGALGNAWAVKNIVWVENADAEMTELLKDSFDPASSVIIDKRYEEAVGGITPSGTATVSLKEYRANHLTYDLKSGAEDFVVFSEVFYDKGWKAYIDGNEVPHARVNYAFRGMKVPAGDHTIEFKYDLPLYHQGATISLISSSLVIILLIFLLFRFFKGTPFPEV